MYDKTASVHFTKDSKFHKKTKHIKRHYHFIRDSIKGKGVAIRHISTSKMIADLLTEPIVRDAFKAHAMSLGLRRL